MASICITSAPLCFARSSHGQKITSMAGLQRQSYSAQPATKASVTTSAPIVRRSANYPPSLWSSDFLQSLTNNYVGKNYETRLYTLKEKVRTVISNGTTVEYVLNTLGLVDDLQRIGISYHFTDEISNVLKMVYMCYYEDNENRNILDLNLKALSFRLLRQHGYDI
nr:R-linalool synthase QH1, chloroplastic-like [Tanacetum cinerariifolium]